MLSLSLLRGFCQVKKIPKIRKKLGSGWVGQAPTRIFFFFEILCFLCVFYIVFMFSKKNIKKWIGEWVSGVWLIRVFLGFLDFFNLTKPLSMTIHSKHETFVYLSHNVGTTSKALGRHCTNVIRMFCLMGSRLSRFICRLKHYLVLLRDVMSV